MSHADPIIHVHIILNKFLSCFRCSVSLVVSKIQRKWSSVASLLLFSDIILLLLRDECFYIRETTSKLIQILESPDDDIQTTVPSRAEEQFIDWLDKQLRCLKPENSWTVWIQLIELQLDKSARENEEFVDEVFEKCEANVFGEAILVCKKLFRKLEENLIQSDHCAEETERILMSVKSNCPEL